MHTNKYLPILSFLIFSLSSTATAVTLNNMTVTSGKTFNLNSSEISTSGNVTIQNGGTCYMRGDLIYLHPGFEAQTGSFFSTSRWDGRIEVPTNLEEFKFAEVIDARHEAPCHDFADNGATYIFKIVRGRIFYTRNDVFMGEFSLLDPLGGAVFKDYTQDRNRLGHVSQAPFFEMVAADNNRVIAKGIDGKLYWASMIAEFKNDYKDYSTNGPWQTLPGCYAKVDPDEVYNFLDPSQGYPSFWGDPNSHFATNGYWDTSKIQVPDLNLLSLGKTFDLSKINFFSKRPILSTITTTRYPASIVSPFEGAGPILPDLMQVVVEPCRWYLIDATPPRNSLNSNIANLSNPVRDPEWGISYEDRKISIFNELSASMVKIGKVMLDSRDPLHSTDSTDGEKICKVIQNFIGGEKNDLMTNSDFRFANWISGMANWGHEGEVTRITIAIQNNINPTSMKTLLNAIEEFYDTNLDTALVKGYVPLAFDQSVLQLSDAIWNILSKDVFNFNYPVYAINNAMSNHLKLIRDGLVSSIKQSLVEFCPSNFVPDVGLPYIPKSAYTTWQKAADQLHAWNTYFKYPSDIFAMVDTRPYKNDPSFRKTKIRIDSIIDIGVANTSRYEHEKMQNGGELGSYFGSLDRPEAWDPELPYGLTNPSPVDGHGFVDGTSNFFMLAQIQMKETPTDPWKPAKAVLWLDEQEFFSERWRVLHPRDAAFEGLPGHFAGCAFPVLQWFNGENMNDFELKYWTPYQFLTPNARMANSRYATVIADDNYIYSTSFFWAITDRTWRWRDYSFVNTTAGDEVDKKSIGIRDDQTIYLKGKKVISGEKIDGYWYQRCLPPDNLKKGAPKTQNGQPVAPDTGYGHPWNFMSANAFEVARNNYFRMGMYENSDTSTEPDRHYRYKGYDPHTHIYKIDDISNVTYFAWPADMKAQVAQNYVYTEISRNSSTNVYGLYWDSLFLTKDGKFQKKNIQVSHPQYATMNLKFKPIVTAKFWEVGNEWFIAYTDPRNDDFKLNNPLIVDSATKHYPIIYLCDTNGVYWIYSNHLMDLNVWADLPLEEVAVSYNSSTHKISCGFDMPIGKEKYRILALKIGYIENGAAQSISFTIDPTRVNDENVLTDSLDSTLWTKLFSPAGLANYGTSIWLKDAFGNGNVFKKISVVN